MPISCSNAPPEPAHETRNHHETVVELGRISGVVAARHGARIADCRSSEVINLTQMEGTGGLIVTVRAGIGYDEAPGTVENLLLSSADAVEDIKKTPKPFVLTPDLNSHDVTYELHATVKAGTIPVLVRSRLNRKVLEVFNDAGVQIMTPFYTGDPDEPKIPGG